MASIELLESVYITHLMSSPSFISFIAVFITVISAVWMDVSLGSAALLVMFANTAAKHTFHPVLFENKVKAKKKLHIKIGRIFIKHYRR